MANYLIDSLDIGENSFTFTTPYGICATAESTITKTVDCDNFLKLETGAKITVKFANASVKGAKLKVANTGEKPIYYRGADATASTWKANDIITFVYDGINWVVEGHVNLCSYDSSKNAIFPADVKSKSITIGNTTITEAQLQKLLKFIDNIEILEGDEGVNPPEPENPEPETSNLNYAMYANERLKSNNEELII